MSALFGAKPKDEWHIKTAMRRTLLDLSTAHRPGLEPRRINIDLPDHMLAKLDKQAALRGVTRQSLIKMWLFERLETLSK